MPRAFSEEFRERAVDLVLTSGLSLRKVAPELGVSVSALDRWVRQGKIGRGIETGSLLPPSDLHAENMALKREFRKTREELGLMLGQRIYSNIRNPTLGIQTWSL